MSSKKAVPVPPVPLEEEDTVPAKGSYEEQTVYIKRFVKKLGDGKVVLSKEAGEDLDEIIDELTVSIYIASEKYLAGTDRARITDSDVILATGSLIDGHDEFVQTLKTAAITASINTTKSRALTKAAKADGSHKKGPRITDSERAGLVLSIARTGALVKKHKGQGAAITAAASLHEELDKKVGKTGMAMPAITAVVQRILEHILVAAIAIVLKAGRVHIQAVDVQLAIDKSKALTALFPNKILAALGPAGVRDAPPLPKKNKKPVANGTGTTIEHVTPTASKKKKPATAEVHGKKRAAEHDAEAPVSKKARKQ